MKIIKKVLPRDHNLFLFGDTHRGAKTFHENGWKTFCDMMLKPYKGCKHNFGVDHGDVTECIPIEDYRFDRKTTDGMILSQIDQAIEDREPIKDNILVILNGNHTERMSLKLGDDIVKRMCDELGVTYGTYATVIEYFDTSGILMYRHFAHHGYGTIHSTCDDIKRRKANMNLSLKRKLKDKFGEAILMSLGHTHKLIICKPEKELYMKVVDGNLKGAYTSPKKYDGYIHPDHRWYVNTGSFFKLYGEGVSTYAEKFGYDPIELGFAIAVVRDGKIEDIDKIVL